MRLINAAGGQAEQFVDPEFGHGFSPPMRDKFVNWLIAQWEAAFGNPTRQPPPHKKHQEGGARPSLRVKTDVGALF